MADAGYEETEKLLKALEIRISKEYKQASEEAQKKLDDYLRRFETKDKLKKKALDAKLISKHDYTEWRKQQIMVQERWTALRDELAEDYHNANKIAKSITKGYMPEVYAINHNYGTYQVERDAGVNTSYTLYNAEAVERLMKDNPQLLPDPGKRVTERIANGLDVRWNRQQIQSVMMQSILLGDSIPEIAHRLAFKVGDSNHKAAIRNARTMTTGAQNAGRLDSYKRAEKMGVEMEGQMWIATLDERTRHSHRNLDGEIQPIGHEFSNGCRYPGDPFGAPQEVWNCRCSTRAIVEGLESKSHATRDLSATDSGDYEEWKKGHSKPNPIDLPEKKARAIKQSYINEYNKYSKLDTTGKEINGKIKNNTSGAVSGALNPDSKEAQNHANMYYESVRHMKTDYKRIAQNTGFSERDVEEVKRYVFLEKHDLGGEEKEYLYPDYEMAQSWQRLIEGKNIQEHDIILLNHEIMERKLVNQGYTQAEAHTITEQKYNYAEGVKKYHGRIERDSKK